MIVPCRCGRQSLSIMRRNGTPRTTKRTKTVAQLAHEYTSLLSRVHALLPPAQAPPSPSAPATAAAPQLAPVPVPSSMARGLLPLEQAALRLAPRPHCLTPLHADFLQVLSSVCLCVCVSAGQKSEGAGWQGADTSGLCRWRSWGSITAAPPRFSTPSTCCAVPCHAVPSPFFPTRSTTTTTKRDVDLNPASPILEVDPKATGLVALDLLRHFHHAGLVLAALGRHADAADAFKTVRPTMIVHANTCLHGGRRVCVCVYVSVCVCVSVSIRAYTSKRPPACTCNAHPTPPQHEQQAVTAPAHALSAVALDAYKKLLLTLALLPSPPGSNNAPAPPGPDEKDAAGMEAACLLVCCCACGRPALLFLR